MRRDDDDGEHMWLRQSARFTVGGQERTVEIALPLRPGATPDEIERLLAEADAGMERLTQHLDQRIAALLAAATQVPSAPSAPAHAPVAGPTVTTAPTVHPAAAAATQRSQPPAATPSPASAPAAATPARPAASAAEAPVARAPSPAPSPAPAPTPARPAAPPAPAPASAARPASAAPASAASGEELTRPAFLAETRTLGLTPPQVMERLGVRTLDGLNLREALELLRRQLVRDTPTAAPPRPAAPASAPAPTRAPTAPRGAAVAPTPPVAAPPEPAGTFFDEEDDFDVAFEIADDEPENTDGGFEDEDEEAEAGAGDDFARDEAAEPDELALDDVPDFAAEPAPPPSPRPPTRPQRGQPAASAAAAHSQASVAERTTPSGSGAVSLPQRARARELLAHLRAAATGGTPSRTQLAAFSNIVADQLGAPSAATLARDLFGAAPERLGTDQLNALIQWGKTDAFAEEAPVLLALLRAEREARAGAAPESAPSARSSRAAGSRAPGHAAGGGH